MEGKKETLQQCYLCTQIDLDFQCVYFICIASLLSLGPRLKESQNSKLCFTHHTNGDRLWQLKHLLLRYKMYYKKLATKSIQQQAPEYEQHESCLYTVKNIL